MATKAEADAGAAPPKSKKMLLIIVVAVVVLALAGVAGWLFLGKKHAADAEEDEEEVVAVQPQGPPVYLPLEHMVVNLADPGGERVAQIGVTFQLAAPEDVERVKAYLPSIRNDILMLVKQRKADDLLQVEGLEQLANEIQEKTATYFGKSATGKKGDKKGGKKGNPIQRVLFSSLIVQ
ncbi:MAG: flagellar basal body-associated protein FliL [Hylemonella sp.]